MSGMRLFCWASSWMCSSITPSTIIKVQRHGPPLRHLRPPVFFFPREGVLMEGVTRRLAQAWLPPPLCPCFRSICSGLLLFSSTSSSAHSRKIVAFLLAFSLPSGCDPMSGLPNVHLSLSFVLMCLEEVSPGRCLTQNFLRMNRKDPPVHLLIHSGLHKQRTTLRTTCDTSHLSGSEHLLQCRTY